MITIEAYRQLDQFKQAFHQQGLEAVLVPWRTVSETAAECDLLMPLLVWDYFEGNEQAFLAEVKRASATTALLNPPEMIHWNANKRYLDELQKLGTSVIPTILVDRISQSACEQAFEAWNIDKIVIKPVVGGGAWRQVLLARDEPLPPADQLPPGEAMIQPFEANVVIEGEYSFLYFDGQFSHALLKTAAKGDYRVQAAYGGAEATYEPAADELAVAEEVLASLPSVDQLKSLAPEFQMPLYARVDLIRGGDGKLQLIELELIEPFLYLSHAQEVDGVNQGAKQLAESINRRIAKLG